MTVIEKDYRCEFDRDDVLTVAVNTEDQDVTLSIEGPEVILTEKKIRKLIKQLKKALPKEEKVSNGFTHSDLEGNIKAGDRIRLQREGNRIEEGTVIKVDCSDNLMPLYIQVDGINYWPVFGATTRVFKIN